MLGNDIVSIRNKAYVLIGFFIMACGINYAQDKRIADSLETLYALGDFKQEDRLQILSQLAQNHFDPERKLQYSNMLIEAAQELDSTIFIFRGFLQKGTAFRKKGELSKALENYLKANEIAIDNNLLNEQGRINITIADVYSLMDNSSNAIHYYDRAITILRVEKDSINLATALINAGDEAFNTQKYDLAVQYFEESGQIFKEVNYPIGTAYNLGNMGMVFAEQEKNNLAESNINEAITILEELGDYPPICEYLIYMSDIYLKKENNSSAVSYATRSLDLAQQYNLKKQLGDANLQLSEIYEKTGDEKKSLAFYKAHIAYRDSVKNLQEIQKLANLRTESEVAQKQIEVDLADQRSKNQRNIAIGTTIGLLLIAILAIGLFRRNKYINKTKQIIEDERNRSDNLLLNILPEETAAELKQNGKVKAKKYEAVTVLFTDFKGFTSYSEKLSPEALVETIGFYFSKFDAIIEKHGLEKIKTIGDAYMAVAGIHDQKEDHASRMTQAAFDIAACVEEAKKDVDADELTFDVRIGINTGPVVAGVVGTKKFAYDIWGDAVNVASRMESMSEAGKINISENTYQLIKHNFDCEYRGEIDVKNRGKMKMYFVNKMHNDNTAKALEENKIEL